MRTFVLAMCLSLLSVPVSSGAPERMAREVPRALLLRTTNDFYTYHLSVALGDAAVVSLAICDDPVTGYCRSKPRIARTVLAAPQSEELASLAYDAGLFDGDSVGGQLDRSFRSLEVRGDVRVAVLVTSLNPSFQSGPRKKLLELLFAVEDQLEAIVSAEES